MISTNFFLTLIFIFNLNILMFSCSPITCLKANKLHSITCQTILYDRITCILMTLLYFSLSDAQEGKKESTNIYLLTLGFIFSFFLWKIITQFCFKVFFYWRETAKFHKNDCNTLIQNAQICIAIVQLLNSCFVSK